MHNIDSAAAELNNGFPKLNHRVHHWKMSFNINPGKQVKILFQ